MLDRKINLEKILRKHSSILDEYPIPFHGVLKAMKEACEQTLELAAENANLEYCANKWEIPEDVISTGTYEYGYHYIDKQSILTVINQIE